MKIKKDFIIRVVGGEHVVVPIGKEAKRFQGMITLNETGAFLWEFFTKAHTVEEATKALMEAYNVEEETARNDAVAFAETLENNDFIE